MVEISEQKKTSIGIVESNETLLHCFKKLMLEENDFEIVFAENSGKNALAKLSQLQCDILLADEILFDMNGIELLKSSRAINPQINVLFLIKNYSNFFLKAAAENRATSLINLYSDPKEMLILLRKIDRFFIEN